MPLRKEEKGPHNIDLQKAVQYLRDREIISKDKDIALKMNVGAGTVSNYVNGMGKASDKFRKNFEIAFGIDLKDFKDAPSGVQQKEKPGSIDYQAKFYDAVDTIKGYNEFLQRMMESNFAGLLNNQEGGFAIVIELLKRDALREAGGNQEKAAEILGEILRRIAPKLSHNMKDGILDGAGK
jgi:transcriptional regulator with XRE-family HTH domain